jgi:hypothetical protein
MKTGANMDQELKQHLDRIESKLDQIMRGAPGTADTDSERSSEGKSAKETTTGIPNPKVNPREYNLAMKKYDTPDGNKEK